MPERQLFERSKIWHRKAPHVEEGEDSCLLFERIFKERDLDAAISSLLRERRKMDARSRHLLPPYPDKLSAVTSNEVWSRDDASVRIRSSRCPLACAKRLRNDAAGFARKEPLHTGILFKLQKRKLWDRGFLEKPGKGAF